MKKLQSIQHHYKMYKAGKRWLIGSITFAGMVMTIGLVNAKADTASTTTTPSVTATTKPVAKSAEPGIKPAMQSTVTTNADAVDSTGKPYYVYGNGDNVSYTTDQATAKAFGGQLYRLESTTTPVTAGEKYTIKPPVSNGALADFKLYGTDNGDGIVKPGQTEITGTAATNATAKQNPAFYYVKQVPVTINYTDDQQKVIDQPVSKTLTDGQDIFSSLGEPKAIKGYTVDFKKSNLYSEERQMDGSLKKATEYLQDLIDTARQYKLFKGSDTDIYQAIVHSQQLGAVSAKPGVRLLKVNYVYTPVVTPEKETPKPTVTDTQTTLTINNVVVDSKGNPYYTYTSGGNDHFTTDKNSVTTSGAKLYVLGSQSQQVKTGQSYTIAQPADQGRLSDFKLYGASDAKGNLQPGLNVITGTAVSGQNETKTVAFYYEKKMPILVNYVDENQAVLKSQVSKTLVDGQSIAGAIGNPVVIPGYTVDWAKSNFYSEYREDNGTISVFTEYLKDIIDEDREYNLFQGTEAEVYQQIIGSTFLGNVGPENSTRFLHANYIYKPVTPTVNDKKVTKKVSEIATPVTKTMSGQPLSTQAEIIKPATTSHSATVAPLADTPQPVTPITPLTQSVGRSDQATAPVERRHLVAPIAKPVIVGMSAKQPVVVGKQVSQESQKVVGQFASEALTQAEHPKHHVNQNSTQAKVGVNSPTGRLPQTDEKQSMTIAGLGLVAIFTGLMTALGFGLRRKK